MSGSARLLLAQGSDETVCEVTADCLLEAVQGGLLGSPIRGGEGRDVRENPRRRCGSVLDEHGGTHGTRIGMHVAGVDPWRE